MKKMKKLVSLVLTAAMVLAMGLTAFASEAGGYPITITGTAEGHTYNAYQIFKGTLLTENKDDNVEKYLGNIDWGSGVNQTAAFTKEMSDKYGTADAAAIAEKLSKNLTKDNEAAKEFASIVGKYLVNSAGIPNQASNSNTYTINVNKPGYYLVQDETEELQGNDFYTRFILEVVGPASANVKGDVPESHKYIVDNGQENLKANEASIGDTVNYKITGTVPESFDDYKSYYYVFKDQLSSGLTFAASSVEVYLNDKTTDITKYFYVGSESNDNGTAIVIGLQNLKAVPGVKAGDTIIVYYDAILNEKAAIAPESNPNTVHLEYYNDPNQDADGEWEPDDDNPPTPNHPVGETPEDRVETYTTELAILKIDADTQKPLTGAEFTLTGENAVNVVLVTRVNFEKANDGDYWKLTDGTYTTTAPVNADDETNNSSDYDSVTQKYKKTTEVVAMGNGKGEDGAATEVKAYVGDDGNVKFTGLGVGKYKITESVTPDGYNTIPPIEFTVEFDKEGNKEFAIDEETSSKTEEGKLLVSRTDKNKLSATIENQKGSLLPSTGGIGTTIFYIIGGILVIGAGVLLITKKRMTKEV